MCRLPSVVQPTIPHLHRVSRRNVSVAAVSGLLALRVITAGAQAPRFRFEETTIAQVQAAFRARTLTCRSLVDQYLKRIEAHDKTGAALNAIVVINPDAATTADELDRRYRQSGPVGPLHCVPLIVK